MSTAKDEGSSVRRRLGRPRLTSPSPEFRRKLDEIIQVAIEVFHDRGFDNGSLDDVAAALGLAKPSLYYYFHSKAELLYLIFDRALTTALRRLDALSGIEDPKERVAALIAHQVHMVASEPRLFAVFFEHRPRIDARYAEKVDETEREYLARFASMVDSSVLASVAGAEPRYTTHAIMGMVSWLYQWFDPDRDDSDEIARTMIRIVVGGDVDVDETLRWATNRADASVATTTT